MYDITVLTLISQGTKPHAKDEITFYGVGETTRDFIAGSCKSTLFKLMKFPEDTTNDAWNLKYRTVVRIAGSEKIVSDTKLITFPGMDGSSILEFKRWAIKELQEIVDIINTEMTIDTPAIKKRNILLTLLKMLWTRINNSTSAGK